MGEIVAELDRIEKCRSVVKQDEVAQMQIAVAMAHPSATAALIEKAGKAFCPTPALVIEPRDHVRIKTIGCTLGETTGIFFDDGRRRNRPAVPGLYRRIVMKSCNGFGSISQQTVIEPACKGKTIEEAVLIEAVHDDNPIDRGPVAIEGQLAMGVAGHRHGIQVKAWRRAAVYRDFHLTGTSAFVDGRKVEIGEADGAFEFIGALAREEDRGNVGVNTLDRSVRKPEGLGRCQE